MNPLFISDSFEEFYQHLLPLRNKEKGDIFEEFSKFYFQERYGALYYKLEEVSNSLKEKLSLPRTDKGIDALIEENNNYISVQVKFRAEETLPFGELSTYTSLHYFSRCFKRGVIITTARSVGEIIPREEFCIITYWDLVDYCQKEFWSNLRKLRNKETLSYFPRCPLPHQEKILFALEKHFSRHDKGQLLAACGTGKTLIGLWTAQLLNSQRTLILVPSLVLLKQTYETWQKELLLSPKDFLLVGSEKEIPGGVIVTTNQITILTSPARIVISTYHSCHLLSPLFFSLILYDEAHHTTNSWRHCLYLSSFYKLFLTATGENLREEHGKVVYEYTLEQAIREGRLADYRIVICNVKDETEDILEENKLVSLEGEIVRPNLIKVIEMISLAIEEFNLKHLILFCNRTKIAKFVLKRLRVPSTCFKALLTADNKGKERKAILKEFTSSSQAVLSSCRVINEGLDVSNCDSICFVENCHSHTDIIQRIGRCLRKQGEKIGHVLLPIVSDDLDSYTGKEYRTITKVLQALALQDKYIEEKILVRNASTYSLQFKPYKVQVGEEIDLEKFKEGLFLRAFSRHGENVDMQRLRLQRENERRKERGEELLITRRNCQRFLGEEKKVNNWLEYALTPNMYNAVKERFYKTPEEFSQGCKNLGIKNYEEYVSLSSRDKKLPPIDYIEGGLYNSPDKTFNLILSFEGDEW